MFEGVVCDLCGSDNYEIVYKTYEGDPVEEAGSYKITDHKESGAVRVVRCRKCGLIYLNPRASSASLCANYAGMEDEEYVKEEAGRRLAARSILSMVRRLNRGGARLLDVGCSTGFLLDEARREGWEVSGVELSDWAVRYARERLGLTSIARGGLKEASFPSNQFDAVILKDTIEHLEKPRETLIEVRRILKPNGIICVNTPNIASRVSRILKARWWGVKQSHLYYFTPATLSKMLEAAGFVPLKVRAHERVFTLRYWIEKLSAHSPSLARLFAPLAGSAWARNRLVWINVGDQMEIYARKSRKLEYLAELEAPAPAVEAKRLKTVVVLPAYNAVRTLERTLADIPRASVDEILLVDDASSDGTADLGKRLGIKVVVHPRNQGYGGNQKTCYRTALEMGADIVVMVHPDYQYDPTAIPDMIAPIQKGEADAVFGSRMMKHGALEGGMPLWKHNANILLTALENVVLGTYLTEYHSGFRAYSARYLRNVAFERNSDGFVFDTEIIVQGLIKRFRIEEVPIRTRYFDEASTIKLWPSIVYGLGILRVLLKYLIYEAGWRRMRQFA